MADRSPSSTPSGWLGWALFLGVSWTWCIGMFLPVLLIRDFGNAGWWIFALPNIFGAAAMGWLIRTPAQSVRIVAGHRLACETFSAVTIAFQIYFVATVVPLITHQVRLPLATFAVIAVLMGVMIQQLPSTSRWLAAGAWVISLGIGAFCIVLTESGGFLMAHVPTAPPMDLMGLALVCLLGFATCPYLDLTFHRARQFSAGPRRSFGVGFGLVFCSMIVFTYFYAHWDWTALPPLLVAGLGTHLILQCGFTVAAHVNELRGSRLAWLTVGLLTGVSLAIVKAAGRTASPNELPLWELGYRTFMGFYGLLFPAYVWLVMLPRVDWQKRWLLFFAVVVVAAPAYGIGFLLRDYRWLSVGVGLVLLARIFLLSRRSGNAVVVQQNSAPI